MISFIVHNKAGDILRTGTCSDADLALQAGDGEFVVTGEANDEFHAIVDGRVVDKPPVTPPTEAQLNARCMAEIRKRRNQALQKSDWTQLPDATLSADKILAWQAYRESLRDLPQNYPDATTIDEVNFPSPPA